MEWKAGDQSSSRGERAFGPCALQVYQVYQVYLLPSAGVVWGLLSTVGPFRPFRRHEQDSRRTVRRLISSKDRAFDSMGRTAMGSPDSGLTIVRPPRSLWRLPGVHGAGSPNTSGSAWVCASREWARDVGAAGSWIVAAH